MADLKLDVYHGDDGLDELLKREDIDAVIVALPIPKQPEIIEKALKAGKHVLSEVSSISYIASCLLFTAPAHIALIYRNLLPRTLKQERS